MTKELQQKCMRLLTQAKRGDEVAHRQLVDIVSRSYTGMIRRFYVSDPILGDEDIKNEFYWGIWRAVKEVDHRGDPIFHLAQRGQWVVKSLVTAVNRRRHGTSDPEGGVSVVSLDGMAWGADSEGTRADLYEVRDDSLEADQHAVVEIMEDRHEAKRRVLRILVHADLAPRQREVADMVLSGEVDLEEIGAKKQVADRLGVSSQRVTQIVGNVKAKMQDTEAEIEEAERHGYVFQPQTALT